MKPRPHRSTLHYLSKAMDKIVEKYQAEIRKQVESAISNWYDWNQTEDIRDEEDLSCEWELTDGIMAIVFFAAYYESEYDKGDRYTPPLLSERRSYKVKRVIIYDDESRMTIVDTTDVDIEDKV